MSEDNSSSELKQFNVKLPANIIAAINRKRAAVLEKTAQRVTNQEIAFRAFALWLTVDGLGLMEAFREAKILKAKTIIESELNGKPFEITITGEDAKQVHESIRAAMEGERQRTAQQ